MTRLALGLLATTLAVLAAASPAGATYPGRNGAVFYSSTTSSGDASPLTETSGILAQRSRFADPRVIVRCERTDGTQSGGDCTSTSFGSLAFSPNGRLIAFDAGERIGLISAAGGPVTLLPGVTSDDGDPTFTADGKRIVFTGPNDYGRTDIYARRVNGSGTVHLLVEDARQPAVSVRGVLAFVSGDKVYVQRPDRQRLITSGVSPDWSPDGKRLVIIRPRRSPTASDFGRIYTVRANGHGLTRVGRETYAASPVWSPDGRWIAYAGFDLGVQVKLVGTPAQAKEWAPTQVSGESGTVVSFSPAWRPRPR
jgi:Tol biopolymer transport system component